MLCFSLLYSKLQHVVLGLPILCPSFVGPTVQVSVSDQQYIYNWLLHLQTCWYIRLSSLWAWLPNRLKQNIIGVNVIVYKKAFNKNSQNNKNVLCGFLLLFFVCLFFFLLSLLPLVISDHDAGVGHLALFSLRTESDNPDATCELSP